MKKSFVLHEVETGDEILVLPDAFLYATKGYSGDTVAVISDTEFAVRESIKEIQELLDETEA